jgi:SPP1 family predicted phage head-tail adaptor
MSAIETVPIGFLNRRIEIDSPVATTDGSAAWIPLAIVWAGFAQLSASERDEDGRFTGVIRWRFTIRWRADVTSLNRIGYGQRLFRIIATADPTGNQRYLVIEAEEELR